MNKMIGKTWKIRMDGELRTYEIIAIDAEGWIKIKREGVIVTRTDRNLAIQLCEVQWANEAEPVEMHWDFIEEVTKKT